MNNAAVTANENYCATKIRITSDCRNPISTNTIIAEISNIPIGGIKRWNGNRMGSVTRRTKARNVFRVKTNQDEIKRIKINKIKMLSKP